MTYKSTVLARSFSRRDRRKLGCWALAILLIIAAVSILDIVKPKISSPAAVVNLQLSMGAELNLLTRTKETLQSQQSYNGIRRVKPVCNFTRQRSDMCEMKGDIRFHGNSSTVFLISSSENDILNGAADPSWHIRPYARKIDSNAMNKVRTITVKTTHVSGSNILPDCSKKYNIPAIIFSTGGYAGNQFHDFSDVLIPLYLTSIKFNGEVLLLFTDTRSWWTEKHQILLQKFSNYKLIDMDEENGVLCFPRIIIGLNATDKELGIDPSQSSHTMKDFRRFLRSAYSLKRETINNVTSDHNKTGKRPRLLVISRNSTRRLTNIGEIAVNAKSIGFDVVVQETGSKESEVSKLVNSFDVLVGVHGAGLANMVYLPDNAVVIQIVPLGEMEWIAKTFVEDPAREMKLQYLEYKITANESSLAQQYPNDHEVFKDPGAIYKRGWVHFKSIFMDKQDIKLDMSRFRETLLEAHKILQS